MELPCGFMQNFETLGVDPQCAYKRRGYASFIFKEGVLTQKPHGAYETPLSSTKPGRAGKKVDLTPLPAAFLSSCVMQDLQKEILKAVREFERKECLDAELNMHLIRTSCEVTRAMITPGFHQDGFHYVCLLALERINARGALTQLSRSCSDSEIFLEEVLCPGNGVIFDDRRLWHHATDLEIDEPSNGPAFRSMLIVTVTVQ